MLLVAALLYARAEPGWPPAQRLADHADRIRDGVWRDLAATTMPYYGLAHGLGGVAYASLMWALARGVAPPPGVRDVLNTLAGVAELRERGACWPLTGPDGGLFGEFWPGWCHGNAGYVFLWNLAHASYGEDRFAQLAEQAAWLAGEYADVGHLCCGAAGKAYAALNQYRSTGDVRWHSRAVGIADRAARAGDGEADLEPPLSLYEGASGWPCSPPSCNAPSTRRCRCSSSRPGSKHRGQPGQSWGAGARCAQPTGGITLLQLRQTHYQRRAEA